MRGGGGGRGKGMRLIIFTQHLIKDHSLYLETGRYSDLSAKNIQKSGFQSSRAAVPQCTLEHSAQIGNSCLHAITD